MPEPITGWRAVGGIVTGLAILAVLAYVVYSMVTFEVAPCKESRHQSEPTSPALH